MTRAKWTRLAAMILIGGGVGWLLKLIAIPTTGGEDYESPVIALFFFVGLLGMLVGSTALGSRLAEGASLPLYLLALLVSPIAAWVVFMLLDGVLKPVGEAGPVWYRDEAGITAMALLMIVAGVWVSRYERQAVQAT